jgi:hypothetical protein
MGPLSCDNGPFWSWKYSKNCVGSASSKFIGILQVAKQVDLAYVKYEGGNLSTMAWIFNFMVKCNFQALVTP